ncbi:tRNA-dihydrouridine synthase family protein [Petroclostridium sp. X23]|uniref:tRNA-dihydrouridine synthase family protein n=1 Tax=Petroclostridium sp. X23 TaxID=3045146 RepID=UPI0024AD936F|nr:tRNA-dihydrouridine synthase family protein [Petroclostridium sp. X23]WHH58577.1 tRNA-dihydrouridine synthase family protein [Petroclostridium sp. X23]
MNFYFAPMEGLSGYIYRNAHRIYFNSIDKYFSPFISANESGSFKKRELDDLAPENNQDLVLIPQILTNKAKDFILMANKIKLMGYDEINLNLGCPSGTVVAKNKGAGFLAKTAELDGFLYEIFAWGGTKISLKTRIGKEHPDEFYQLIEIFNKYPIEELTIHPRIQKDFYKNKPNIDVFKYALSYSKNALCYNGDIFTMKEYKEFTAEFPDVHSIMIGRGLLVNPGLTKEIKNNIKVDKNTLREFHDKVYSEYKRVLFGDVNILYKMKNLWFCMISMFSENEKYAKKIKKSVRLHDYEDAVSSLFREQNLLDNYEKNLISKFK